MLLCQNYEQGINAAKNTGISRKPDATTAYLSAIVAARTNDKDGVYSNLKMLLVKMQHMVLKHQGYWFSKFWDDATFQSIVK